MTTTYCAYWSQADTPVLDFMVKVAETLEHIHTLGVIHADVKPENLMVEPDGRVTLIDFGLSCQLGSQATSIRGTREYMAPEQLDQGCIDARTDLYNLGACFYHLLTGRQVSGLLAGTNGPEFMAVSRKVKARPIAELNTHIPEGVVRVITSCLRTKPERRPSSAAGLLRMLRPVVREFNLEA